MPVSLQARAKIEEKYSQQWQKLFSVRLWVGRNTQKLFGGKAISKFAVKLAGYSPGIASQIMKRTHGQPF
jgi:hypothetical protein